MADLPWQLQTIDIIVSATSSPLPLLSKRRIQCALQTGKRRPLFILDLGVPRDIEPEAAQLEDVYLYHMDHLQTLAEENMKSRLHAAQHAQQMIELYAQNYMKQLEARDVHRTISAYREKLAHLRDDMLTKALLRLKQGVSPEEALIYLAQGLTNKILHTPSVQLRQAGVNKQQALLKTARELFDL